MRAAVLIQGSVGRTARGHTRRVAAGLLLSALLVSVLSVAGCSTYQPTPLEPAGLLAELRDVDVEFPTDGLDPSQAVALALVHNPELRMWRRKREIAAGQVLSESAWENPELRVSLDNLYSRINTPFAYALDLRFFPLLPGEYDAKVARLQARERRVLAQTEEEEARIAHATLRAHARLVLLDTELATVQAAVQLHGRIGDVVSKRVAAGATTRLEGTLVRLRREELTDELQTLGAQRGIAQAELATLLGAAPDATIDVRGARPNPVASAPSSEPGGAARPAPTQLSQAALEDIALQRRPDLRALAERYEEREHQLHLKHMAQVPWPRHVQAGFSGLPNESAFDLDIAIELPLNGQAATEITIAELTRDHARDAYRARLHTMRGEIRLALLELREQDRRRRHLTERVGPVLREAEELLGSALQAGAADILAVVGIETRVLDARRAAAQSAHDYEVARVRLAAATGSIRALP